MDPITEGQYQSEFVLSEANGRLSRDNVTVTVPAGETLEPGLVLGQISASGKYVPYDNAATDGSGVAAGVLVNKLINEDEDNADDVEAAIVNLNAEVRLADLQWKTGLVDADKTAGLTDLLALGIKARS